MSEFDMTAAVASIADGLGLTEPDDEVPAVELEDHAGDSVAEDVIASPSNEGVVPAAETPAPRAAPKSWAKEQHERWGKLDKDTQDYIEKREKDFLDGSEQYRGEAGYAKQLKGIIDPYKPMLAAMGVDETQAVQYLLNAQYRLTSGTAEQRASAYKQIGKDLGLALEQVDPNAAAPDAASQALANLQARLDKVDSDRAQELQERFNARLASAQDEVAKFQADPANEHFQEVASDMKQIIESDRTIPLAKAYERAVWANPVTREKELLKRQTAAETERKEKLRTEGEAAKRATAHNVRGVESRKAPTEKKGSMDDTMRDTLRAIKERAH